MQKNSDSLVSLQAESEKVEAVKEIQVSFRHPQPGIIRGQ